jgi:hypothetical protein
MDQKTLRQLRLLSGDMCAMWTEAASVIWLRSAKIAKGGPDAMSEASLMVSEKIAAHQELLGRLATGKLGKNPLAVTTNATHYMLKGVRANRRRLSRG